MIAVKKQDDFLCIVENSTRRRIAEKEVERIAAYVAEKMATKKKATSLSIYIHIAGVSRSAQLNERFHGQRKATDVLSFPPETRQPWADEGVRQGSRRDIAVGDIVICPQIVERHAHARDMSFKNEFAHVLIHGMLHVLGFHHEKSARRERELQEEENTICQTLGYDIPHPEIEKSKSQDAFL